MALAGYAVVLFMLLRMFDFNPTGPIHIGDIFEGERFWTESTRLERESAGYDGQYFFYLAHDPLLRDPRTSFGSASATSSRSKSGRPTSRAPARSRSASSS